MKLTSPSESFQMKILLMTLKSCIYWGVTLKHLALEPRVMYQTLERRSSYQVSIQQSWIGLSIYLIDARGNGPGIPDEVRPISDPTSYIRKADGKFDITSPDGLIYSCDSCEFYIAKGCQVSGLRGGIRTDQTCDVEFQPREDGSDARD
ncbi:hypothetical protein PSTT_03187 [Puccinia striiformis]|uniref:Uncharacterized protein n=1 Tax=Puccinia striiformis TaxID=27350 RepID=A0A2S4VXC4_9BASI|nr:hypothetical protein PSTT_03187 [Puccinia striiformis]